MNCERYWQDGILQVERGVYDPHRDTCDDCRAEHRAREQIVRAMPRVGARASAPDWQLKVWSQIASEQTRRARRSYAIGGALVAACAIAMIWLFAIRPGGNVAAHDPSPRPWLEIVSGRIAMRSTSAHVGDRVRIAVRPGGEVRLYRANRLVLRCPAWRRAPGCVPDMLGLVADAELATAGDYQIVVIPLVTAEPTGSLDGDLAAVVVAGGEYKQTELSVR